VHDPSFQQGAPMNFADLKAFVAVAEAGSVNRAAALLNLTQPAVTRRVQSLEAAIGAVLLDRSSKPPTLTEDGRRALAYGRKVLHAVEDLSSQVGADGELTGEFRFGIAPGLADAALGSPLDAVIRSFPAVVPRITSDWTGRLMEALRAGALDAAFVLLTDPQDSRDVELRQFRQDAVVVIAARGTPLPSSPDIAGLGLHSWVLNPQGCGFRSALQRAFDREHAHLNLRAEVQGYDLQLSLIARGIGLGLVPLARLKASPLRKQVKVVTARDFRLSVTPALAHGARHHRFGPVVEALARAIEKGRPTTYAGSA
jgi:DNA-binding transcriptional LysR family regulator